MKRTATIQLFYTSDVHGHAMPVSYGTKEEIDIGLAKYATAVKGARAKNPDLLVADNGDLIQGTPLMTHFVKKYAAEENPMVGIMNRIGIEAGVLGNHEFNFGKNILQTAVDQSNFPWLSANILDIQSGKTYFGPPYKLKVMDNGIRIAFVGVTTHYIPNWEAPEHIAGLKFADAFSTLKYWVEYIRENERPNIIIGMYHGGLERDPQTGEPTEALTGENQGYQMCTEIEGLDILLTGHQHRQLVSTIHGVLAVQPGNNAETYGKVEIVLEKQQDQWKISAKDASIETLEGIEADSDILRYMEDIETSTQSWLDEPVGFIEGEMLIDDPFQARIEKHPFIEFIQKVQMEESDVDISVTALLNNEARGFGKRVTMRDIVSNYMYPNTLVVLELNGKDIKAALEKSADYFILDGMGNIAVNPSYMEPKPQHYNYDMWEGIQYTINVSNPSGERVENITYQGKPLQEEETYQVVLNNYRASGGGNYDMFKGKPVVKEIQKDAVELIRSYFEKYETVPATATPNFVIKAGDKGISCR
ncbi:bifunctional metallophosphatase/5'-nucleotidase [Virgibacillus sediminis]|uniref:Bifunctional metallophosphatase/5'-nucleotidase n=1 Tax=Virgibacillus sediminis TaxID=202260 RepID=A0ABV7A433_9BACI